MHADEVDTSVSLVRALLEGRYADLPITPVESAGTDNALYRLGDDLVVRLPRIDTAIGQISQDIDLLPRLAPHLPLAVPEVVTTGLPGHGFPFGWAVYRWLDGADATVAPVDPLLAATALASFLLALQGIDLLPRPASTGRGGPLAPRDPHVHAALAQLDGVIDTAAAASAWQRALDAPAWDRPPVFVHGDLHAANLLVHKGKLSAVLDWGCAAVGDPAVDLLPAWGFLPPDARSRFRSLLDVDDATWERGRGWALSIGLIALPYYTTTNPVLAGIARRMIDAVLSG